jgi:hypothetical protein
MKDVDQNPNHCWITKYFAHLNHRRTDQEGETSGGIFDPMALYWRGHFDIHTVPRILSRAIYSPYHRRILSVGSGINRLFLSSPDRASFFGGHFDADGSK